MRFLMMAVTLLVSASIGARASEIADIYNRVKSSVVVIETTQKEVSPFGMGQLTSVGGLGSGVLISNDGQVMTAAHVVQAADQVLVHFMSGETIPGRVLASEAGADLALVQLERKPSIAKVAKLGDSDKTQVGDQVFIVGAPFGIDHTLTVGYISARRIEDNAFGTFLPTEILQTDAAINTGNSGGPMFNLKGEVIGIVSYIISQTGGFEGLGFVVTANMAKKILLEERALWSGILGQIVDGELARVLNVPGGRGMLVQRVAERSAGAHLGLHGGTYRAEIEGVELVLGGDIILEARGVPLNDLKAAAQVRDKMRALGEGDAIVLKVLRGGEIVELKNFFFRDLLIPTLKADDPS